MTPVDDEKCLTGIRVVDLSRILAGPVCTMTLGDQGADIIKVERPGVGDDTRTWGPPFAGGEAAYYLCCNRNKRSIAVDLRQARGVELIKELVKTSDVLVENFKPGLMKKFGLDYETLGELNPKLVYCSVSAYGQDGPYVDRPGYDMVLSAVGGLMWITGEADGPPCKVGVAITDVLTGISAAGAIVSALFRRERTGRGQHLDCALMDIQVAGLANIASNWLVANKEAVRWGTAHASIVPYQVFPTRDFPISIAAANDKLWTNMCEVMGHAEWATDERFVTNPKRVENRATIIPMIEEVLATKGVDEWMEALVAASVPAGPVNNMERLFSDPQVAHRNMIETVSHPTIGDLELAGVPVKYSETPGKVRLPPPLLGEHTDEILAEVLAYSAEEIAALRADEAVA